MRAIAIPYGKGHQMLHAPEQRLSAVLTAQPMQQANADEQGIIRDALAHPIKSLRLCELVKGKAHVLVITSDHTRPVPSRVTLPLFLDEIRLGHADARITLLVATGMHRPTTEAELRAKFGDAIVDSETIVIHRADQPDEMVHLGTLPSGGALWLNKLVKEADLVISEGFIEPHFFAGFSGGRKSILPGIASRQTVMHNHNAQFIQSPMARQGILARNPIHRDMLYAAKAAQLRFILNVLLDHDKRVIAAFAGDPEQAHLAGCRLCEQLTRVTPVVSDIAITSNGGYPLDQNIYQAVKGMTAAEACVRPGGIIILCAALGDGHGGEAFYRWFAERASADAVLRAIERISPEGTQEDQWEAQILARVMSKATLFFVTGAENRRLVHDMHMHWAPDVNAALQAATALLGSASTITVIPDGVGVIAAPVDA
jgi:nickel-dependent lactate racemase